MGIQSAVMAEQFGTMFQYGKRRISAMSNEEFNKLTFEKLQSEMTTQLQGMIPQMEKQIQAMQPMVKTIIAEFANYLKLATEAVKDQIKTTSLLSGEFTDIATTTSQGTTQIDYEALANTIFKGGLATDTWSKLIKLLENPADAALFTTQRVAIDINVNQTPTTTIKPPLLTEQQKADLLTQQTTVIDNVVTTPKPTEVETTVLPQPGTDPTPTAILTLSDEVKVTEAATWDGRIQLGEMRVNEGTAIMVFKQYEETIQKWSSATTTLDVARRNKWINDLYLWRLEFKKLYGYWA